MQLVSMMVCIVLNKSLIVFLLTHEGAIIHAALSIHTPSARALIQGLAERKAHTGNDVFYIHVRCLSLSLFRDPKTNTS